MLDPVARVVGALERRQQVPLRVVPGDVPIIFMWSCFWSVSQSSATMIWFNLNHGMIQNAPVRRVARPEGLHEPVARHHGVADCVCVSCVWTGTGQIIRDIRGS